MKQLFQIIALNLFGLNALQILAAIGYCGQVAANFSKKIFGGKVVESKKSKPGNRNDSSFTKDTYA